MAIQKVPGGMDPQKQYISLVSVTEGTDAEHQSAGRLSHIIGGESVQITGTPKFSPTVELVGKENLKRAAEFFIEVCREENISLDLQPH